MTNEFVGRVSHELARYEHLLFDFDAQLSHDGIEIRIWDKVPGRKISQHAFYLEPREFENSQSAGTSPKQLCDCLRDYVIGLCIRNPERRN